MICIEDKELPNIKKALYLRKVLEDLKYDEQFGSTIQIILNGIDKTFEEFDKGMMKSIERMKNEKTC